MRQKITVSIFFTNQPLSLKDVIMVHGIKQINGGEGMEECYKQRKKIALAFKEYKKIFIALGDENRQQIFLVLLENDVVGMRVPDITKKTHLSRPAVSHHLKILKDAGLISMHRSGTMNYYYVDPAQDCWNGLKDMIEHVVYVVQRAKENGYPNFKED